jgi:sulfide dehydrogenase cytochrome subunit
VIRHAALVLLTAAALAPAAAAADDPPPGASSCSGCHAPAAKATAVPPIAGRDAAELVTAMNAFRSGERPATVMDRIAKGFSPTETQAIAAWLATQK